MCLVIAEFVDCMCLTKRAATNSPVLHEALFNRLLFKPGPPGMVYNGTDSPPEQPGTVYNGTDPPPEQPGMVYNGTDSQPERQGMVYNEPDLEPESP